MRVCSAQFDLIVAIVPRGRSEDVMTHARRAGAEGGTILGGRGPGVHERLKILGIPFEPEKDIVLSLVDREISNAVLKAIYEGLNLDQPGTGLVFLVEVSKVAGIAHLPCVEG